MFYRNGITPLLRKLIAKIPSYFFAAPKSHLSSLYGMDFFTLDTLLGKRFYVFFIIYLQTRQIVRYAVTTNPTRQLVRHQLIEFTWYFESNRIYLVHDSSGEFCNINYWVLPTAN